MRNRGEPPLKKRALTPPPAPPPTMVEKAVPQGLPLKLQENQVLPTLSELQDQSLLDANYQNIADR